MVVKKVVPSLESLSLHSLCQVLLQEWKNTYYTNYQGYSEQFTKVMSVSIPPVIYNQLFDMMVDSHARFIKNNSNPVITSISDLNNKTCTIPRISHLVGSIITPTLQKLNLHCLRHMGLVVGEIEVLRNVLECKLSFLDNLVEISLKTICSDEILRKIGSTCSKLTNLDISYNHKVTDYGLWFLTPSEEFNGCPKLVKVSLFECSVTHKGIIVLLEGLPKLKFLGYRETGQSLKLLHSKTLSSNTVQPLELAHLNNLGRPNRASINMEKLECNSAFVNIISRHCPKLNGLKVRVDDAEVRCLQVLTTITILELVYNLGRPRPLLSSPGKNTAQYLQLCGEQFVQLSFVCDAFTTSNLKVVCEQCKNLKRLNIRSKYFNCEFNDITMSDKKNCVLANLEEFHFTVGYNMHDLCNIPCNIFSYVLHKSYVLTEVILKMRNTLLSDIFMEELFSSIKTSKIKKVLIRVPYSKQDEEEEEDSVLKQLNLTMVTVENLIAVCPEIEEIGQLLMWNVSSEEIEELKQKLQLETNSALLVMV